MEEAPAYSVMERSTRESGRAARHMAQECAGTWMGSSTKATGSKGKDQVS